MFPMMITIHNSEELDAVVRALAPKDATEKLKGAGKATPVQAPGEDPKPAPAEATAPSSGTTSASAASSAPSDSGESVGNDLATELAKKHSLEISPTNLLHQALVKKVVASKGRDAAVALLAEHGVKVATQLQPEQIEAFCLAADKVLSA